MWKITRGKHVGWDTALKTCKRPPKYIKIPIFSTTSKAKTRQNQCQFSVLGLLHIPPRYCIAKYPGTQFLSVSFVTASGTPFLLGKPWGCPRFNLDPSERLSLVPLFWGVNGSSIHDIKSCGKVDSKPWVAYGFHCVFPQVVFFENTANSQLTRTWCYHLPLKFMLESPATFSAEKSWKRNWTFATKNLWLTSLFWYPGEISPGFLCAKISIGWWFQLYTYPVLKNHGVSSDDDIPNMMGKSYGKS